MMAASTVLFLPRNDKCLKEMLTVVEALPRRGYTPVVLLEWPCDPSLLNVLKEHGVPCLTAPDVAARAAQPSVGPAGTPTAALRQGAQILSVTRAIAHRLPSSLRLFFRAFSWTLLYAYRETRMLRRVYAAVQPDVIVLQDERNIYRAIPIKIAQRDGIPSLVVPLWYTDPPAAARARVVFRDNFIVNYSLTPLINRIVARLIPQLVYEYEGAPVLYFTPGQAVAAWLLGVMPSNPWVTGGGRATRLAVEGERERCKLLAAGVPAQKLVVTGKPRADVLFQRSQGDLERTRAALGVRPETRMILLALPQLVEHGLVSWGAQVEEISFLLQTLTRLERVSVVVSLNPASREEHYRPLIDRYGALLPHSSDVFSLVSVCDIFVANVGSSTVTLGIGCRKPTVAINFWGLTDLRYVGCEGVCHVRAKDQLGAAVQRLLDDPAWYRQSVQSLGRVASEWMLLDGRCTERVIDQIDELARWCRSGRRAPRLSRNGAELAHAAGETVASEDASRLVDAQPCAR